MSSAFDIRKCFALAISSLAVSAWRFAQQSCAAMELRDPAYQKKHRLQRCFGGDKRDRTADLLNAIQALSQLSYTPIGLSCLLKYITSFLQYRQAFLYFLKKFVTLRGLPKKKISKIA